MPGNSESDIDMARVLAEIDEEVRLRRASGDLPPTLDRELNDLFDALTPTTRHRDEFLDAMDRAEEASFVDVDVPTASSVPGGSLLKRGLAKLITWFAAYLAQQTTVFARAASRGLSLLGQRVELLETRVQALEDRPAAVRQRVAGDPGAATEAPALDEWADVVAELLGGRTGRVLHAECRDGSLLTRLLHLGLDAYGVEPDAERVTTAVAASLEVRLDHALDHLGSLPAGALAGLVLSGCVERLPPAELLDLADHARRVVATDGLLVVISASPEAWGRDLAPVDADLSPGRPFHAETWRNLLAARGFTDLVTRPATAPATLERLPGDTAGGDVLNANLDRIDRALFGPSIYAVTAVRTDAPTSADR